MRADAQMRRATQAPIIGPRTPEQLAESVGVCEMRLDADLVARMEGIWA